MDNRTASILKNKFGELKNIQKMTKTELQETKTSIEVINANRKKIVKEDFFISSMELNEKFIETSKKFKTAYFLFGRFNQLTNEVLLFIKEIINAGLVSEAVNDIQIKTSFPENALMCKISQCLIKKKDKKRHPPYLNFESIEKMLGNKTKKLANKIETVENRFKNLKISLLNDYLN